MTSNSHMQLQLLSLVLSTGSSPSSVCSVELELTDSLNRKEYTLFYVNLILAIALSSYTLCYPKSKPISIIVKSSPSNSHIVLLLYSHCFSHLFSLILPKLFLLQYKTLSILNSSTVVPF